MTVCLNGGGGSVLPPMAGTGGGFGRNNADWFCFCSSCLAGTGTGTEPGPVPVAAPGIGCPKIGRGGKLGRLGNGGNS